MMLAIILIVLFVIVALLGDHFAKFMDTKTEEHRMIKVERKRTDEYIARRQYDAILAHTEAQREAAKHGLLLGGPSIKQRQIDEPDLLSYRG